MRTLLGLTVALAVASSASAVALQGPVRDNFDSYNLATLRGQTNGATGPGASSNAWEGPIPAQGNAWGSGPVVTVGTPSPPPPAPFSGQVFNPHALGGLNEHLTWDIMEGLDAPIDEGQVTVMIDMWAHQPIGGSTMALYLSADTLLNLTPNNFMVLRLDGEFDSLFIDGGGIVGGRVDVGGNTFPVNQPEVGIHVEADFDFDTKTGEVRFQRLDACMAGPCSASAAFAWTSDNFKIGSWIIHNSLANKGGSYDNFALVPEPASLALLSLGGLTLLRRRRA
jgi:uncharacterized membrane protein